MPWAAYADVTALLGTAEAERIAMQSGAVDTQDWWDGRIASAAALCLAAIRGLGYTVPEAPENLSEIDARLLASASAEQAILGSRPFMIRAGGSEDSPPEFGPTMRSILSGLIRLDLSLGALLAFVPSTPAASDDGVIDNDNPASIIRAAALVS